MRREYYGQLSDLVYKNPVMLSPEETALIIIDAQKCITKEYFIAGFESMGIEVEPLMPILDQLESNTNIALENINKILKNCRKVLSSGMHRVRIL